jgi:methionyl-tRNA formyltransferase
MKILCCGYRDWAKRIYKEIEKSYNKDDYNFLIINSKKELSKSIITNFNPDLILWYGWSWIIKDNFIKDYFSVMLHPSPLPKYRGGSPIQNQIINGEVKSAVTLFKMDEGIDTGDILYQEKFFLKGDLDDIFSEITYLGIKLTKDLINNFPHNLKGIKQDNSKSSYYKRRKPEQSEITLKELEEGSAKQFYNKIRCLQDPYPNAFIKFKDGSKLFLTKSYLEL